MRIKRVLIMVMLAFGGLPAFGGPRILSYSGSVLDSGGNPIADGAYPARFSLYDEESTGSLKWQESDSVEVVDGLFTTLLGDTAPFSSQFTNYWNLWLEVEIDIDGDGFEPDEVYLPRTRITSAAWAFDAERLMGKPANYFQVRVTGSASAGQYIRAINADGTVVTAADQDTRDWPSITGKPSTFPPDSHDHDWPSITGKPSTFPPSTHGHGWGELTAVPAGFADGIDNDTFDWPSITGKPSAFPPSTHGHGWSELTGIPAGFADGIDNIGSGDITGVTAGPGLLGGGSSGNVTVSARFADNGTSELIARADHMHWGGDVLSPVSTATLALSAGTAPWSGLTGVPAGFSDGIDHDTFDWPSITGKPATFPPSTHGHGWGELSSVPAGFADGIDNDTHDWPSITGIPAGFADGTDNDSGGDITGVGAGTGLSGGGTSGSVSLSVIFAGDGTADTASRSDHTHPADGGWGLTGNAGTTSGTNFLGTTDNVPLDLRTNNTRALRLEPTAVSPNIILGHDGNSVTSGAVGAVVGGGGGASTTNRITDNYGMVGGGSGNQAGDNAGTTADAAHATIGGGEGNTADGAWSAVGGGRSNVAGNWYAAVGGGQLNTASGLVSTIGGGWGNQATGGSATVGGGSFNAADGPSATVPGGNNNTAAGSYSFAAGRRAKANHPGAFVWADSTNADFGSAASDQFLIRATGGVGINTNSISPFDLHVAGAAGLDDYLNMGADGTNARIVNVADPTTAQDAATKTYVDNATVAEAVSAHGLQGHPVATTAPAVGQMLRWSGTAWEPATPLNHPPVALLDAPRPVLYQSGAGTGSIVLSLADSYDPEGSALEYAFDTTGRTPATPASYGSEATTTATYTLTGDYLAEGWVRDSAGAVSRSQILVSVFKWGNTIAGQATIADPHCSLAAVNGKAAIAHSDSFGLRFVRADDTNGSVWHAPVTPDVGARSEASLAVVNGRPAIAYRDITNNDLKYVRAQDAYGTTWSTPLTVDSLGDVGRGASLAVVNGSPAIAYVDFTIGDLRYVRANDVDGAAWGTTVTVANGISGFWHASLAVVDGRPAIAYKSPGSLEYIRANDANGAMWGLPVTLDTGAGRMGFYPSLAVVNGHPAVAYQGHRDVKYVRAADVPGTSWGTPVILDSSELDSSDKYISLAVVNSRPAIAYYDPIDSELKYLSANDADGGSWATPVTLDSVGTFAIHASLAEVSGRPAVGYYDNVEKQIKCAIPRK